MLDHLIVFALSVYWLYHLLTRSDLTATLRAWVLSWAPGWLAYIGTCVFCFTFHVALLLTLLGVINASIVALCAAPVVNMVLDMVVRWLIRANEPPVMGEGQTVTQGDQSITTWRAPNVIVGTLAAPAVAGQMAQVYLGDTTPPDPDWRGIQWGLGGVWPWPKDIGRRVRAHSDAIDPRGAGKIGGLTGVIREVGAVTCAWVYYVTPDNGDNEFAVAPSAVTFLT